MHIRLSQSNDYPTLALLHNAASEPHFHTTAAALQRSDENPQAFSRLVLEHGGQPIGFGTTWLPDFDAGRAWIGLYLHPDHLQDKAASLLFEALLERLPGHIDRLWTSLRQDYLSANFDPLRLGFVEVHRTFGGGFYLDGTVPDTSALEADLLAQGMSIQVANSQDARLNALYAELLSDKVAAPPTIPVASTELHAPDLLWSCAFVALHNGEPIGLAVPERSRLNAWNAVLGVRQGWRRRGIGTALQARVCRALQDIGMTFLNTAGVKWDTAYLGVLRRLGASIEPDWIAYGRERG